MEGGVEADAIRVLNIAERDVQGRNVADLIRLFGNMSKAPEDAKQLRGKVVLGFASYDGDQRPNWAIPEIRGFVQALDSALPYFPYFLVGEPEVSHLLFYLFCLVPFQNLESRVYGATDLLDAAKRKVSDVTRFCQQIGDDAERATEPILLNLPAPIAKSDPGLVEKILERMRPSLLALERQLTADVPTPETEAFAGQILPQAAELCGIDRSRYGSHTALLREILARTAREVSNEELDRFQKGFDACTERLGSGKLGISSIKLRELVRRQKHAAYRWVELHLVAAASQPGYLQPATAVAAAIHIEFGDDGPMRRVQERATELGARPENWMPGVSPDLQSARGKFGKQRPPVV